jgi:hypothetical protein
MEIQHCVRCGRGLKAPQGINTTGDKAIAIFVSALTVGIRPRIKSRAQRNVFCIPCAASISLGPAPEGAFNLAVYGILCDVVSRDKSIVDAAWEQMAKPSAPVKRMPGSKPDKTLEAPVMKVPALQIVG